MVLAWLAWSWLHARSPPRPAPGLAPLDRFSAAAPRHSQEARDAFGEFMRVFRASFDGDAARHGAELVRALFTWRARVNRSLREVRMRLPGDLKAERALANAMEDADRAMMEHIQDVRERCGAPLVHPGPVGDAYYGRWYRASNDVVM